MLFVVDSGSGFKKTLVKTKKRYYGKKFGCNCIFSYYEFPCSKNSSILIYVPIQIIVAMQQFLSFYPYKMGIFQWVAEGLSAVPYNRDWKCKATKEGIHDKKKQDMNKVQKRQHYSSVIRPFPLTLKPLSPFLASLYFMDILSTRDTYRLTLKGTLTPSPFVVNDYRFSLTVLLLLQLRISLKGDNTQWHLQAYLAL